MDEPETKPFLIPSSSSNSSTDHDLDVDIEYDDRSRNGNEKRGSRRRGVLIAVLRYSLVGIFAVGFGFVVGHYSSSSSWGSRGKVVNGGLLRMSFLLLFLLPPTSYFLLPFLFTLFFLVVWWFN